MLTIITPHYNATTTLARLIESIPVRSDIQIIVVDDKSDLHPRDTLSKETLNRIILLDNESAIKGPGVCRNIGLQNARGKWILFADADDFFVPGFFTKIRKFFDSDYDIVFFKFTSITLETGDPSNRHLHTENIINNYLRKQDHCTEMQLRFKLGGPVSKMIRFDLIKENSIYFDEISSLEDVMFSAKVGLFANRIFASNDVIYCATSSGTSLSIDRSVEHFEQKCNVFIQRYRFLKENLCPDDFECLNLNGWWLIIEGINSRLRCEILLNTYHQLRRNGVEFWKFRFLFLLIKTIVLRILRDLNLEHLGYSINNL